MPLLIQGQIQDSRTQIEAIIESVVEDLEEDADAALIVEDLERYIVNPLNINTATHNQLSRLHLLNDIQIMNLIEYREKYGEILTLYEMNSVDGINPDILLKLKPFIFFGPLQQEPRKLSDVLQYGRHEFLIRSTGTLQVSKGYKESEDGVTPYKGNRFRYYTRYSYNSGDDISAGITAEKDPGEAFFADPNHYGFDFYSAHLNIRLSPVVQNITVGDFVVRNGQGIVLWQGFSMGKSGNSLNVSKTNQGIRPYTSNDENQFFRGAATSLKIGDSRFSFFFSKKNRDGNLSFSDSVGTYFTSIQSTGYHRTNSEIDDKNSVGDLNAGIMGSRYLRHLKVGVIFLYQQFEFPLIPSEQLYNRFSFKGQQNLAGGADYLFTKGKYQVFGEAAVSKSGGKAALQGATAYLHDRIQLSVLFRHFDKHYHSLWAAPFAESSSATNETGLYTGVRILPVKYVTLLAYSDFYRSEWIKYTTAGPSNGCDLYVQADVRPSSRFQFYIRYKNEEKDRKFRINGKNENHPEQYRKSRIHFQYNPTEILILKSRVEFVQYTGLEKENGIVIFQDIQLAPARVPLNFSTRLAWFNTDSYNSRIYAYENDLLYTFAIPTYFGNGFRSYVYLKYKLGEKTEFWLKLANDLLKDTDSLGSGYNTITGNKKTELKFQLRLKI